jgi:hypothetical protein
MRCEERSADRAASPCSPSSVSARKSRFARTLVSGVRSSCDASATNSRWRRSIASCSSRDAASAMSIPSSVRASSVISSSAGPGSGRLLPGSRVRSISRAATVSSEMGVIARLAIIRPASSASPAPPTTPLTRNRRTRRTVASTSPILRPYWRYSCMPGTLVIARLSTR